MKNVQENSIMTQMARSAAWGSPCFSAPGVRVVAQNLIQSINSSQQAGQEVVRIELSEPLTAVPAGFTVQTPPRIALDLPGVGNALGRSSVEHQPRQLALGQRRSSRATVRASCSISSSRPTTAPSCRARSLLVVLEGTGPAAGAPSPRRPSQCTLPQSLNRDQLPLKDIDFRRGPGRRWPRDRRPAEQPGRASTFASRAKASWSSSCGRALPDSLRRRLDVTDFGTPVQTVSTFQSGDRVRMVVEPQRRVGAQRLSERQPVRAGSAAAEDRPEQADARPRLRGREAVAQFPEHRGAGAAAGHCRLHQLQRRDQRHRHRQRHACA